MDSFLDQADEINGEPAESIKRQARAIPFKNFCPGNGDTVQSGGEAWEILKECELKVSEVDLRIYTGIGDLFGPCLVAVS